jgi:hydrogenase maturation protease
MDPCPSERVVIMGLGNVLLTDDGAGVAALHLLARDPRLDPMVRLIDGGTLGLALLDYFEPDGLLVLIDAVRGGAAPGTVMVLEGDDVARAAETRLSVHQVGVADLLQAAEHTGRTPRRIILVGVEPASLELGVERTPAVQAALPAMVDQVLAVLERAGVPLGSETHALPRVDVADALGL